MNLSILSPKESGEDYVCGGWSTCRDINMAGPYLGHTPREKFAS